MQIEGHLAPAGDVSSVTPLRVTVATVVLRQPETSFGRSKRLLARELTLQLRALGHTTSLLRSDAG